MPREISLTDRQNVDILTVNEVIIMHKQNFLYYVRKFLTPVILILLGLILTFSPDSATTLLIQVIGWALIASAAGLGVSALMQPGGTLGKVLGTLVFGVSGLYMVMNPLSLAAWFGRLIGILLLIQGLQNILYQRLRSGTVLLPILTAIVGAVLLVLTMTTSRLVFTAAGFVVLVIGVLMLVERIHGPGNFREPDDSNIIDSL